MLFCYDDDDDDTQFKFTMIMMTIIHLGSWNEAPVKSHQETSLADAVDDHCVVHLDLDLRSHDLVMMMMTMRVMVMVMTWI